jgi:hypothetical protein
VNVLGHVVNKVARQGFYSAEVSYRVVSRKLILINLFVGHSSFHSELLRQILPTMQVIWTLVGI